MIIEFASLAGQLVLREQVSAAARLACFLAALLGQENTGEHQIAMADALLIRGFTCPDFPGGIRRVHVR